MSVLDQVRLVIYRVNRKGLEVFLLKSKAIDEEKWSIPAGVLKYQKPLGEESTIELEPTENEEGYVQQALAMEADWHEIPSIRAVIKEDVRIVKDTIKEKLPELEEGTFVAVKEAFKKVLPHEYKMIKELKDIIVDRNQTKYV